MSNVKLVFSWIGAIVSFALILTMYIITMTPGIGTEPLMLILDIVTFVGWCVLVACTIYALVITGRGINGSDSNATSKVAKVWIWCCLSMAIVFFLTSLAGFSGQIIMVISTVISLTWGYFIFLCIRALVRGIGDSQHASSLSFIFLLFTIFCIVSGSLLTFGFFAANGPAWISKIYHWYGVTGSVMGLAASYTFARLSGDNSYMGNGTRITLNSVAYGVPPLLWLILWIVLGHSIVGTYPAQGSSGFKLPYPGGVSSWVVQGNHTNMSHSKNNNKYAYDFRLSGGSPVIAAKGGTVIEVVQSNHQSYGLGDGNKIVVDHGDGTTAHYIHIEKNSALVTTSAPNNSVTQGQKLATVGNVGNSMTSHIHFEVHDSSDNPIPVSFDDVKSHKGIPRSFRSYRSGNKK